MRIEQLMYLVDIAKTKSFSKTAQNFYITQQGASDAIKKLEKEFNVILFNRTKQGVFLTEIGRSFEETAQEMIALYHTLEDKADAGRLGRRGQRPRPSPHLSAAAPGHPAFPQPLSQRQTVHQRMPK